MYIGKMAKLAGVSVKAIRHYESIGLLSDIKRNGSYRVYTHEDVEFVKLIKQAQSLGLSLAQLHSLKVDRHTLDWLEVMALLASKRRQVDADIAALHNQKALIEYYRQDIKHCLENLDSPL